MAQEAPMTKTYPAVYRFICPDGRSYVGSRIDCRRRQTEGILPSNKLLREAIAKYPPRTWVYQVLECWPSNGCSRLELRAAEQRHIDQLRTMNPQYGFNIWSALRDAWNGEPVPREPRRLRRLLSREKVIEIVGTAAFTRDDFPRPVKLFNWDDQSFRWFEDEIIAYQEARAAERYNPPKPKKKGK
jgi:predicted DNA-binding transcriptional regulator AlpA